MRLRTNIRRHRIVAANDYHVSSPVKREKASRKLPPFETISFWLAPCSEEIHASRPRLGHLRAGAVPTHPPVKSNRRKNMKRQLLGCVVLLGLAGTMISANLPKTADSIAHPGGTLIADGDQFPPPFPPKPPTCETKLSPQIIADGDPFPPPFPPKPAMVQQTA